MTITEVKEAIIKVSIPEIMINTEDIEINLWDHQKYYEAVIRNGKVTMVTEIRGNVKNGYPEENIKAYVNFCEEIISGIRKTEQ